MTERLSSEAQAIRKRIRQGKRTSLIYHMLRVFPIRKNKIVFTAFEGDGGFCCSPRYIAEELLRRSQDSTGHNYEMIWLVNNMERQFPAGIRKVRNTFWNRAYHMVTSKVWVDNSRKAYGTAKRRGQFYIQTWHAALEFKPVGKFRGDKFPKIAYMVSEYDSKLVDYVLSNSDWCTEKYPEMLLYDGEIIKTGLPRSDVLVNGREEMYRTIRERYGIPEDAKIVMFAPTFRGGGQKGKRQVFADKPTLDFEMLTKALAERFGGTWYVMLRLHPQLAARLEGVPLSHKAEHMVDVSQADDMNEVLAAADVFVTDYSSAAFDALNIPIPVFLYVDDLEDYIEERGQLMWDLEELPFPVAKTNEVLAEKIAQFDEERYTDEVDTFLKVHGVIEDGKASKRVADVAENIVFK